MKNLKIIISEKLKLNKDNKNINKNELLYGSNWQWFNNLICNVQFEEDQLRGMFANLPDDELKVWIKEVKDCYSGTRQEDEANKIGDDIDLARFYYRNPVTE